MKKQFLKGVAYNPTNQPVQFMADGHTFYLDPGEEEEVYGDYLRIISKSNHHARRRGIVILNYDDAQKRVYPTYEDYKKAKAEEGLRNLVGAVRQAYINERQALRDIEESGRDGSVSVFEEDLIKPEKFKKKLDNAEKQLKALKGKDSEEEESQQPKRRGRPKKDESITDQGQD